MNLENIVIEVDYDMSFDDHAKTACHTVLDVSDDEYTTEGTGRKFRTMSRWTKGAATEAQVVKLMAEAGYRPAKPKEFLAWIAYIGERGIKWGKYACVGYASKSGAFLTSDGEWIQAEKPQADLPSDWEYVAVKI